MSEEGLTSGQIVARGKEEGIMITTEGVRDLFKKYRDVRMVGDKVRRPRGSVLSEDEKDTVEQWMKLDRNLSREEIQRDIKRCFGKTVSLSTITSLRHKNGWTFAKTRYCQLIRAPNVVKRLEFATEMLRIQESWTDVVFTDETKVECGSGRRYQWRKKGDKSLDYQSMVQRL